MCRERLNLGAPSHNYLTRAIHNPLQRPNYAIQSRPFLTPDP